MDPDEIEASLTIPADIADAIMLGTAEKDQLCGDWPSARQTPQGIPPGPDPDAPMLHYLLWKAQASIDAGMDIRTALIQLAVHAWFEGGVYNYDRGRRDVAGPD